MIISDYEKNYEIKEKVFQIYFIYFLIKKYFEIKYKN